MTVSTGSGYACGLREDGAAVCWADYEVGSAAPSGGDHDWVDAERYQACRVGIDSGTGEAVCWSRSEDDPSRRLAEERFEAMSVGAHHACGLMSGRRGGVLGLGRL